MSLKSQLEYFAYPPLIL